MYVVFLHQFSIGGGVGLGARGAALLGGGCAANLGIAKTWLVGGATAVASWSCGAEAEGATSTTTTSITPTGWGDFWTLMALTKSRAAVMQALDLGKAIRIAPNKVSIARRTANVMAVSFSQSNPCSPLGGHGCCCCCCCCCCCWCCTPPHTPFFSKVATATTSTSLPKGRPSSVVSPRSSRPTLRIWKINNKCVNIWLSVSLKTLSQSMYFYTG